MRAVVIGVGSNLGAREAAICAARSLLDAREGIDLSSSSKIYETEPLGPPQPRYLNAAFRAETQLSPREILRVLLRTERRLGRKRVPDERWGPRSIDLDLLWDQRGPHESPGLSVPHRELANRDFALAPLLDVAPELASTFGRSLEQLGGPPPRWTRQAVVHTETSANCFKVEVEADSLADACALCVGPGTSRGRPWSSRHFSIAPSAEQFSVALQEALLSGFSIHRASISHCSKSQWALEFHGECNGNPGSSNVRLRTTSGQGRRVRVEMASFFNP